MPALPLQYSIQTLINQSGQKKHNLLARHREGRGMVQHLQVQIVGEPGGPGYGAIFFLTGGDGAIETVGSNLEPLPIELLEQAQSQDGLLMINIDDQGRIINGQMLWDATETSPFMSQTPRCL